MKEKIEDIFMDKVGKVYSKEVYSNNEQFMVMLPNDYTLIAKKKGLKYASVKVMYGVADFTHNFFKTKKKSRKVSKALVEKLLTRLSEIKND